jgi:hypothetical protein
MVLHDPFVFKSLLTYLAIAHDYTIGIYAAGPLFENNRVKKLGNSTAT